MTHEEFIERVDQLARIQVDLDSIEAERLKLIADLNETYKDKVEGLKAVQKVLDKECAKHAKEHEVEIFGPERKRSETETAIFSLTENPPRLAPYSGDTWKKVFARVQKKGRDEYIAHVPELNREKLKADMIAKEWKRDAELRVRIVQEKTFNVYPKRK